MNQQNIPRTAQLTIVIPGIGHWIHSQEVASLTLTHALQTAVENGPETCAQKTELTTRRISTVTSHNDQRGWRGTHTVARQHVSHLRTVEDWRRLEWWTSSLYAEFLPSQDVCASYLPSASWMVLLQVVLDYYSFTDLWGMQGWVRVVGLVDHFSEWFCLQLWFYSSCCPCCRLSGWHSNGPCISCVVHQHDAWFMLVMLGFVQLP